MSFNQFPFLLVRRLENTEKGQLYANWLINYTASYSAMVIDRLLSPESNEFHV